MTNRERIAFALDEIASAHVDTFEAARRAAAIGALFPEEDFLVHVEAAADRQVQKVPGANSMDHLADFLAAGHRKLVREGRRLKASG